MLPLAKAHFISKCVELRHPPRYLRNIFTDHENAMLEHGPLIFSLLIRCRVFEIVYFEASFPSRGLGNLIFMNLFLKRDCGTLVVSAYWHRNILVKLQDLKKEKKTFLLVRSQKLVLETSEIAWNKYRMTTLINFALPQDCNKYGASIVLGDTVSCKLRCCTLIPVLNMFSFLSHFSCRGMSLGHL